MTSPNSKRVTNEKLYALLMWQSARISLLEESYEQLRAKFGLPPLDPTPDQDDMPIKVAAGKLGLSPSGVHLKIRTGELKSRKIGGKVFVQKCSVHTLMAKRRVAP